MSYGNPKTFSQSGLHYLALLIQDNAVPVDECFCQFASIDATSEDLESVKISKDAFLEVAAYLLGSFLDATGMLHLFHEMDIDRDGVLGIFDWRGALATAEYWLSEEGKQTSAAIRIQSVWRGHFERGALSMPAPGMFSIDNLFEPMENQKYWEDEDEEIFHDLIPATVIDDSLNVHDVLSALAALAHSKGFTAHSLFVYICKSSNFEPDKAFTLDDFIEAFVNLCGDQMTDQLHGLLSQAFHQLMDLNGNLRVSSAEFFWVMRQYFEAHHSDTWNEDQSSHDPVKLREKHSVSEQPASFSLSNDEVPKSKLYVETKTQRNTSANVTVNSAFHADEEISSAKSETKHVIGTYSSSSTTNATEAFLSPKTAGAAALRSAASVDELKEASEAAAAKQMAEAAAFKSAAEAAELKRSSEAAAAKQMAEATAMKQAAEKLFAEAAELKKTTEAAAAKQMAEAAAFLEEAAELKKASEATAAKQMAEAAAMKQAADAAAAKRAGENVAAKQAADAAALKQASEIAAAKRAAEAAAEKNTAAETRAKYATANASHLLATGNHISSATSRSDDLNASDLAPAASVSEPISSSRSKHAVFDPKTLVQNYGSSADENIRDHLSSSFPSQPPRPSSSGGLNVPKSVHFSLNRPSTSDGSLLRSELNAPAFSNAAQSYNSRLRNSQHNITTQNHSEAFTFQKRAQNRASSSFIDSSHRGSAEVPHKQNFPIKAEGPVVTKRVLLVETENACCWIRACAQKISAR